MTLLHICTNLAGSRVFPLLFEALDREGLSQTVFVPQRSARDFGKNLPQGVRTIEKLTLKKTDALFFFRKAQRTLPALLASVDLSGVRLVHAHTLFTDGSIARALQKKTGLPYLLTLRYSDIEAIWRYEPHLRPLARDILAHAQQVVFLSPASRDKVLTSCLRGKFARRIAEKSRVIPNGISPDWLDGAARPAPQDVLRVGFAGRLNARKRPLTAVDAVHRASDRGALPVSIRICGDGPLREKTLAALRPGDAYAGSLSGTDAMKRFYADCDLLLVPSSAETFGMVYLEAMSQGLPVLYTKGQGFDGQFPEGEVGYHVPCRDAGAQSEAILALLEDYPARSARCIAHSRELEWRYVAARWMDTYRATGLSV